MRIKFFESKEHEYHTTKDVRSFNTEVIAQYWALFPVTLATDKDLSENVLSKPIPTVDIDADEPDWNADQKKVNAVSVSS
jgi:hypothetical protein